MKLGLDFYVYIFVYIYYIPGTCLSPVLGVQPSKTRSCPIKTGVIWVPGIYIYIFMCIQI